MKTGGARHATYLGVDLTDAYARRPRPIDVCGLEPAHGRLAARFWTWTYEPGGPHDVAALLPEIRAARGTVIDGPHALASVGASMRECERIVAAAGKTKCVLPAAGSAPFAGFIRSSVELFVALQRAGLRIGLDGAPSGALAEQYPGGNWTRLAGARLPKKTTEAGRQARRLVLETLGVVFPHSVPLADDHLDAALGAVIAAAADGCVAGASVATIGWPLVVDAAGQPREGTILLLELDKRTQLRVRAALGAPRGGS